MVRQEIDTISVLPKDRRFNILYFVYLRNDYLLEGRREYYSKVVLMEVLCLD